MPKFSTPLSPGRPVAPAQTLTTKPTFLEYAIVVAAALPLLLLGLLGVLALPAIYCGIAAACGTLAWNLVVVTLFHCAPVTYWQALVVFIGYRIVTNPFRKRRPIVINHSK